MKYIKTFESFDFPSMLILTAGIVYGYGAFKDLARSVRRDEAQEKIEHIIIKLEGNQEIETLFDEYCDLYEKFIEKKEDTNTNVKTRLDALNSEINENIKEFLTEEDYIKWKSFTNEYITPLSKF